jgi:UDP-N-acetylmuramoyl-tripeptide--D-alanyl-D-alanine ligase
VRVNYEPLADGLQLTFDYADASAHCKIQQYGAHNAQNAGAAVTLALACGLGLQQAVAALDGFGGVSGRQQPVIGINQSSLIDDTYNANPDSLKAAVDVLCELPGTPWLALGDMGELGDDSLQMHQAAIGHALDAGVQQVFVVGPLACRAAQAYPGQAHCFDNHQLLAEHLAPRLEKGINLLIKGSRSARMEQLVELLKGPALSELEACNAV